MAQLEHHHRFIIGWSIIAVVGVAFSLLLFTLETNHHVAVDTTEQSPVSTANITVTSPHPDDHVDQTFTVKGKAKAREVGLRLRDKFSGAIISEIRAINHSPQTDTYKDFSADLQITDESVRSEAPLTLEVFEVNHGQETNPISIPLVFSPGGE